MASAIDFLPTISSCQAVSQMNLATARWRPHAGYASWEWASWPTAARTPARSAWPNFGSTELASDEPPLGGFLLTSRGLRALPFIGKAGMGLHGTHPMSTAGCRRLM